MKWIQSQLKKMKITIKQFLVRKKNEIKFKS